MRKIDFTCRKVTLNDLIQCNYGLNDSEFLVFSTILRRTKGTSVKDIVSKIKKDRTTVQKILSKLMNKGLIEKRQINLDRGFMFVYFTKNKEEIISEIEENVDNYFKVIKENLKKLADSL